MTWVPPPCQSPASPGRVGGLHQRGGTVCSCSWPPRGSRRECVRCLDEVRDITASPARRSALNRCPLLSTDSEDEEGRDLMRHRRAQHDQHRDAAARCDRSLVDRARYCSADCAGLCDVCGERWADLPSDRERFVVDPVTPWPPCWATTPSRTSFKHLPVPPRTDTEALVEAWGPASAPRSCNARASVLRERAGGIANNERLRVPGDSGPVDRDRAKHEQYPDVAESDLSRMRAATVSQRPLAAAATGSAWVTSCSWAGRVILRGRDRIRSCPTPSRLSSARPI